MTKNRPAGGRNPNTRRGNGQESHDLFAALVAAWWSLRRAEKSGRQLAEAAARLSATTEAEAGRRPEEPSEGSTRQQGKDDSGFRYVVLYGVLLVLRPLLILVLYAAMLWAFWNLFWWLIGA